MQYNTIQLVFDITLLPYACRAQKRTFTPRLHRCNCNAEHCGRGTCSQVPTWRLERDSNPQPFGGKAMNLPMSHHAPPRSVQSMSCLNRHFLLQVDWNTERDVWWNDAMADQSSECEPEWLDAEDPLFILYTRYLC